MKNLQLLLTNPCTLQWSDLNHTADKHYCNRCEKHIIDLTTKSDSELIQFFRHKKHNVCARLLSSQLNRQLLLPQYKLNWHWLMPLTLGAFIFSPAQAQKIKPVTLQSDNQNKSAPAPAESSHTLSQSCSITITGKVTDENGNPLRQVKLKQKGNENVLAMTDSAGRFSLRLSNKDVLAKFIFNLPGYSAVESYLNDKMKVQLSPVHRIILGGISTVSQNQQPLYLITSGKKSCTIEATGMGEISPDWIEKIEVIKGAGATTLYGAKAANGLIRIEIKKPTEKKLSSHDKLQLIITHKK